MSSFLCFNSFPKGKGEDRFCFQQADLAGPLKIRLAERKELKLASKKEDKLAHLLIACIVLGGIGILVYYAITFLTRGAS